MKRIAVIFGTRPEVIKLSPIINETPNSHYELVLISTGQQENLNDKALHDFQISPNIALGLMQPNQTLNTFLSTSIASLEKVLQNEKVDFSIVHGDTGTALAGALASYNLHIPVFHVEAGLRSGDLENPFPEEMNRKLISQLTAFHFSPTSEATTNLEKEGVEKSRIFQVGNTIVDVVHQVSKKYETELNSSYLVSGFAKYNQNILLTVHRRENHGNLPIFVEAISELARKHENVGFWIPVHPNPNVKNLLEKLIGKYENLHILEPLDYLNFMSAMIHSTFLVTDSGGVQEEATVLGKYCLVLRETTERPELISSGFGELVKFDKNSIIDRIEAQLKTQVSLEGIQSPFGDGYTADRIRDVLLEITSS